MLYGDGVEPYGFSFFTEMKISPTYRSMPLMKIPISQTMQRAVSPMLMYMLMTELSSLMVIGLEPTKR